METTQQGLAAIDWIIFAVYAIVIVAVGLTVSKKNRASTEGYFLAGKSIP